MENEATTKTPIPTRSGFRNFALCTCLHPDPLGLIFAFSTYLSCHEFIASDPPFLSMDYFSVAISFVPSWLSGYKSIMQNKANVKMGNINISTARTKAYARKQPTMNNKRYSKQTQSNPISNDQSQFQTQNQLTQLAGRNIAAPIRPKCIIPIHTFFPENFLGKRRWLAGRCSVVNSGINAYKRARQ